ncbi:hypothetical protein Hsero_1589 [Herbaspirillum seropedicae SmR1]|uniref:Uncharacterized protein n=1 Tax=Herbaspirillum seropedicae (strain SmR1) TaxID=757424 RepID=D8IQ56_HERSS|nr:hypothetical protein Hsero_1589 [Herbaspirillum seropedicae SmR1]
MPASSYFPARKSMRTLRGRHMPTQTRAHALASQHVTQCKQ